MLPDDIGFDTAVSGSTVYLCCALHFLGRYTGGAAALDAGSALPMPGSPVELASIAPHPMTDAAVVRFVLPRTMTSSLAQFDPAGRLARLLLPERPLEAGPHEVRLERGDLSAGIYFLRLGTEAGIAARKLVVAP